PEERVEALAQLTLEVRRQHLLRDAFLGARSLEIRGELLKEYLHQAERRNVEVVDDEHHEFPAPRGHDAEKDPVPLALVVQDREGWLRELPRDLVGRGDDRGAERSGRHHVHRAGEAVLGHHLAGRGHDQHESATPLIPSISCSATTSPSSPDTSIAPRTPRTRVTRSSAGPYGGAVMPAAPASGAPPRRRAGR